VNLVYTVGAFVVALGALIIVHEYGHYLVARICGIKVLRFSIGFGWHLWKKRLGRDGTEWVVAAVPLGGYVKMLDEREGEVAPQELARSTGRACGGAVRSSPPGLPPISCLQSFFTGCCSCTACRKRGL
jgi:regulator of sigma E protease